MHANAKAQTQADEPITQILEHADALVTLIRAEIKAVSEERRMYATLDTEALIERVAERTAFRDSAASRSRQLRQMVEQLADPPALVREKLAAVEDHASQLHHLEQSNTKMCQSTLKMVRGYLRAMLPNLTAYDRRGQATSAAQQVSRYATVG